MRRSRVSYASSTERVSAAFSRAHLGVGEAMHLHAPQLFEQRLQSALDAAAFQLRGGDRDVDISGQPVAPDCRRQEGAIGLLPFGQPGVDDGVDQPLHQPVAIRGEVRSGVGAQLANTA